MASILTGDTFSRPSAQRKIGFSAYKRYALGLALALLWIVFYSWPTVSGHLAAISDPNAVEDLPPEIQQIAHLPAQERMQILRDREREASAALAEARQRPFDDGHALLSEASIRATTLVTQERKRTMRVDGLLCIETCSPLTAAERSQLPMSDQVIASWRFVLIGGALAVLILAAATAGRYGLLSVPRGLRDIRGLAVIVLPVGLAGAYIASYALRGEAISFPSFATYAAFGTPLMLFFVPAWILAGREYVKEHPTYRRWFVTGKGGAARWGGVYSFAKYDFEAVMDRETDAKAPIYIGRTFWNDDVKIGHPKGGRHIGTDNESMMMTVAGTGGGKSLYAIWNTLLTWKGGAFILDPKGEHAQRTLEARRRLTGKPCHVLDPWGVVSHLGDAARYNPLDDIDVTSVDALDHITQLINANIFQQGSSSDNDAFFRENGQKIGRGIVAHVLSTQPKKRHNLPAIYETFLKGDPEAVGYRLEAFQDLLADMSVNAAFGGAAQEAFAVLDPRQVSEKQAGAVMSTFAQGLSWVKNEALRPVLEGPSSFSMRNIKHNRETVFTVIPFDKMENHFRFLRMMTVAARLGMGGVAKHDKRTLFLLDEFAQLGRFEPIKRGLVTMRSQGVKIWIVLQSIDQLYEHYGQHIGDFATSCDMQFFGLAKGSGDAEFVHKALGEYREEWHEGDKRAPFFKETKKALASVSDIADELAVGSRTQYFIPRDGAAMKLRLVPFFENFRKGDYGEVREIKAG